MSEQVKPCSVRFVAAALGVLESQIMEAILRRGLMATGGRSPKTAKVLVADVVKMFDVDVRAVFGLSEEG